MATKKMCDKCECKQNLLAVCDTEHSDCDITVPFHSSLRIWDEFKVFCLTVSHVSSGRTVCKGQRPFWAEIGL